MKRELLTGDADHDRRVRAEELNAALEAQVDALERALERLLTAHEHGMSPLAILQVMQEARTALRAAGRAA